MCFVSGKTRGEQSVYVRVTDFAKCELSLSAIVAVLFFPFAIVTESEPNAIIRMRAIVDGSEYRCV